MALEALGIGLSLLLSHALSQMISIQQENVFNALSSSDLDGLDNAGLEAFLRAGGRIVAQ